MMKELQGLIYEIKFKELKIYVYKSLAQTRGVWILEICIVINHD